MRREKTSSAHCVTAAGVNSMPEKSSLSSSISMLAAATLAADAVVGTAASACCCGCGCFSCDDAAASS